MKKTVMIFGVSSFLGSNLVESLKKNFRIIGTYNKTPVTIPGVTCIPCDVLKREYVSSLVGLFRPDVIIYCVGESSLRRSQLYPKRADALNASGAINCLTASDRYNAKFVYLSSTFVFRGDKFNWGEGDIPLPTSSYGLSVSSAEFYIQRSCLNYLILRCCPLYGRSYNPQRDHWFEILQERMAKNEKIQIEDSVVTGFLDVEIVGKILQQLIDKNVTNRLFHLSSKDSLTRFGFAQTYAKIFKQNEALITPGVARFNWDRSGEKDKVESHQYYLLSTANIESFLEVSMPTIQESIESTFRRFHSS